MEEIKLIDDEINGTLTNEEENGEDCPEGEFMFLQVLKSTKEPFLQASKKKYGEMFDKRFKRLLKRINKSKSEEKLNKYKQIKEKYVKWYTDILMDHFDQIIDQDDIQNKLAKISKLESKCCIETVCGDLSLEKTKLISDKVILLEEFVNKLETLMKDFDENIKKSSLEINEARN